MSTKRTVTVPEAVAHLLRLKAPAARIERLRRHEQLQKKADELAVWLGELGGHANATLLLAIQNAEDEALRADVVPKVKRDDARQAGTRKKRRSHMPQLDSWLDEQDLNQSNDALWKSLPREDETDGDFYRDEDKVVEKLRSGKEHDATSEGFDKRVTAARKRRKPH